MIPPTCNVDNAESYNELITALVELATPLKKYNGASVLMAILCYDMDADRLRELVRDSEQSGNHADARRTKTVLELNDAIRGFLDVDLCEDAEEKEVEQ